MRILVTGTAGFIGFHLARRLIAEGHEVTGVDGMTPYYDVALKTARHAILKRHNGFAGHELMLEDMPGLVRVAEESKPEAIIHLAAQAGVRYSLEQPRDYVETNLVGTFNILELAKAHAVRHLMLASTSSVYGGNQTMPFHETDAADHPLTIYAATKKATEAMSHAYSHLWKIPTTAFRFFTVYGPWGRPDMALFKFVEAMLQGRPIEVYNNGEMARDFTFIDDLVEGVVRLLATPPVIGEPARGAPDSLSPVAAWRVVNIGHGDPVPLGAFIDAVERATGRTAIRHNMPLQHGDPVATFADSSLLKALTGYHPATGIEDGVQAFWTWYREHYKVA